MLWVAAGKAEGDSREGIRAKSLLETEKTL